MAVMLHNLKFAWRQLARNPWTSVALILTLGLGIGVNSAIFSVVDAVVLRPLPYADPEELVTVWEGNSKGRDDIRVADGNFFDLRARSQTLSGLAAYVSDTTLIQAGDASFRSPIGAVTRDFFPIFSVDAAYGRLPAPDEHGEGTPVVAVISHDFWQSAFGGADVLGQDLDVYGEVATVVGVLPASFDFPRGTDVWIDFERYIGRSRTAHNLLLLGRRLPTASLEAVRGEMDVLAEGLAAAHPAELGENFRIAVRTLHEDLIGDSRSTLTLLHWIVSLVLLIACGNIAGILTTRSIARTRELGIRQALGAGHSQLGFQLLIESVVLGVLGSIVGLLLARWSMSLLNVWVPQSLLHSGQITLDGRVVGFTLALGVLTGLLCGLVPAVWSLRRSLVDAVRAEPLIPGGGGRLRWLGGGLVVAQYGFSLAALVVAGLLAKSLYTLIQVDPGFATSRLVTVEMTLPSDYSQPTATVNFYRQVVDGVAALPGVEAVTLAYTLPLSDRRVNGVALREGDPMPTGGDAPFYPDYRVVGSDYFGVMGIRLLKGRDLEPLDGHESEPVVVVNQALSRQMWGDENPIGRRLRLPGLDFDETQAKRLLTVVGVADDVREASFAQAPRPAVYVPWAQHLTRAETLNVVAAVTSRAAALVDPIRRRIQTMDAGIALGPAQTMEERIRQSVSAPRFRAGLLGIFAGLALVLASLGVYGVVSYTLACRQRELAIRFAVGASLRDIQALMLKGGLRLIFLGQLLGTVAVWLLARLLQGLLFEVEATDTRVLLAASIPLALMVFSTCYLLVRQASRRNPVGMLQRS